FFQAEDGIRDRTVTGVQTCALPISGVSRRRAGRIDGIHPAFLVLGGTTALVHQVLDGSAASGRDVARAALMSPSATSAALRVLEIGRASCRERVERRGGGGSWDVTG